MNKFFRYSVVVLLLSSLLTTSIPYTVFAEEILPEEIVIAEEAEVPSESADPAAEQGVVLEQPETSAESGNEAAEEQPQEPAAPEEAAPALTVEEEVKTEETPAAQEAESIPEETIPEEVTPLPAEEQSAPQEQTLTAEGETNHLDLTVSLADNEELFAGYLDRLMNPAPKKMLKASAKAARIGSKESTIVSYLGNQITRIATGEIDSTKVNIPLSVYMDQLSFTLSELGLDATATEDDIENALIQKIYGVDFRAVFNALLASYPYELFWFDKTKGAGYGCSYSMSYDGETVTLVEDRSSLVFSFTVAEGYRAEGAADVFHTNLSKMSSIIPAMENAVAVRNEASALSDLKKLEYYRDWICTETDYNRKAVDEGYAYGDPWQLIYVFDKNPDTTVVCEGYSKAFKYLCDNTSFSNDSIRCNLVEGYMGSEAHMWNLMAMDDGKNYLVDVTNYDQGHTGLFLAYSTERITGAFTQTDSNGSSRSVEFWGYAIDSGSRKLNYYYDDQTTSIYDDNEITLSDTAYVEPTDGSGGEDPGTNPGGNEGEDPESETVHVASVELSETSRSILPGESFRLSATVSPEEAADQALTWESDNEAVATVSVDGFVEGIAPGTAIITVTANDQTNAAEGEVICSTCEVTVNEVLATSVKITNSAFTVSIGKTLSLTATVSPANVMRSAFAWTSSNPAIATVSSSGVVTAKSAGKTTITVKETHSGKSTTCTITVPAMPVSKVALNKTAITLITGNSFTLKETVTPSNATNKKVTWTSSNTKIATVSASGVVKGIKKGTATITVTTADGKKTATCKVTVQDPVKVKSVKLNKTKATLKDGQTLQLKATVNPSNATNKDVTWTSSNKSIATVTSSGLVKGLKTGTATITVTSKDGKKSAKCKITVKGPVKVTGVKLNKSKATLKKGKTLQLKATVNPSKATDKTVTWSSSNTKVATVTSKGKVTAVAAGTAKITVTTKDGKKKQTCTITVK